MTYEKGQQITCPECGADTIVKVQSEMDGWTKVGEYFACAICGVKLADCKAVPKADRHAKRAEKSARLSGFLGTQKDEIKEIVEDDGERRFCRDCTHLMEHPFKVHCMLHNKDVNPMDDCPDFERKKEKGKSADGDDGKPVNE